MRRIGYMPKERGLYPQMMVCEQIIHFALLEGHHGHGAREVANSPIAALDLQDVRTRWCRSSRRGISSEISRLCSSWANPELLVLDEPFSGLDPVAVETTTGLIREKTVRGIGVLFSSHQIDLVERISDRVGVLDQGRVVAPGSSR